MSLPVSATNPGAHLQSQELANVHLQIFTICTSLHLIKLIFLSVLTDKPLLSYLRVLCKMRERNGRGTERIKRDTWGEGSKKREKKQTSVAVFPEPGKGADVRSLERRGREGVPGRHWRGKTARNEGLVPKGRVKTNGLYLQALQQLPLPRERRGSTATAAGPTRSPEANAAGCQSMGGANARGRGCRLRAELTRLIGVMVAPAFGAGGFWGPLEPPGVFSVYSTRSTSLQSIDLLCCKSPEMELTSEGR